MIHIKLLEKAKLKTLETKGGDFDAKMKIQDYVRKDLDWWKRNIRMSFKRIKLMNFKRENFSDGRKTHG